MSAPRTPSQSFATETALIVYLYSAPVYYVGSIAEHHWLVTVAGQRSDRWEVWQDPDVGGESWGHLHRNLLPPQQSVARGPTRFLRRWENAEAKEIAERLEQSPDLYPWLHQYRYWPGPNSNTFVQWILQKRYRLGRKALGKTYWRLALEIR